ncbi:hypothetical protein [Mycolicibacterium sp.]|uniref:hypothetical protein n=1 Tax=Mycolicibacterium sp. TaxID=2320850 RepID=UPI0037C6783F
MTARRPKIYIDENLPHQIGSALNRAFRSAIFSSYKEERLTRVLDLPLFDVLRDRAFDVIVTRDLQQTISDSERRGLRDARLHWVGVREPERASGLGFYSAILSAVAATVPIVLSSIDVPPRAYHVICEDLRWETPIRSEPI